jgi:hypothetical protein
MAGLEELAKLPATQVCTLRYEDFLDQPESTLQSFMQFLGPHYHNADWMRRAKAQIRRGRSAWTTLPTREQTMLQEACRPGFDALRRYGIPTDI